MEFDKLSLAGKAVVITGADSGIGQATAELLAKAGADISLSYHTDAEGAEETRRRVEAAGRRVLVTQADIGDPASVEALFEATASKLGRTDLLIANAGQGMSGMPVAEMQDEKLEQILRTDLMGPLFCARRLSPAAQGGGRQGPDRVHRLGRGSSADAADYVTGQTFVMDGGLTMNWGGA